MQDTIAAPIKQFVRYDNRKLYDRQTASYVTSDDLLNLVRQRQPFEVLGSRTQEPITAQMLCQVLWKMSRSDLPVSVSKVIDVIEDALSQDERADKVARSLDAETVEGAV